MTDRNPHPLLTHHVGDVPLRTRCAMCDAPILEHASFDDEDEGGHILMECPDGRVYSAHICLDLTRADVYGDLNESELR